MKQIIFDVGANDGSSCFHLAHGDTVVYAFEPTPQLLHRCLMPWASENYIVIPKAVSDFNGTAQFKIAGQHDWGCSSLNDFSDGLDKTWAGRTDFKVTEEITVDVIRLDGFIEAHSIPHIDFLHVDTQGSDLSVLRGLGDYISIVKAGVVEAPASKDVSLYKGQYTKEEMEDFLVENGFKIDNMQYQQNEYNIFFSLK